MTDEKKKEIDKEMLREGMDIIKDECADCPQIRLVLSLAQSVLNGELCEAMSEKAR